MHKRCLIGPFLVQLQEVWDISIGDEQRRGRAQQTQGDVAEVESRNRTLKLSMTDGKQERHRPSPSISPAPSHQPVYPTPLPCAHLRAGYCRIRVPQDL